MSDIVIVAATRTPIGAFSGSLSSYSGAALGEVSIHFAICRLSLPRQRLGQGPLRKSPGKQPLLQLTVRRHFPGLRDGEVQVSRAKDALGLRRAKPVCA